MKHHIARALGFLLASLLLCPPAWSAGDGGGSVFGTYEYKADDDADDDGANSGTDDGVTVEPLGFDTLRGRIQIGFIEDRAFSTTTKLRGEVVFGSAFDGFGSADGDLSNGASLTSRVRLNFDTSFTGEDRLRVRLQARDPNGFAKQGKAPTIQSVNPVTFGHFADSSYEGLEPRYTFNFGGRWELRGDYDTENLSDSYVTGQRLNSDDSFFRVPTGLFGSTPVRYDTPTFVGFTLSSAWDEGSGREVPIPASTNSTGTSTASTNGTTSRPLGTYQVNGAYGSLLFHPEGSEIAESMELIPNEFLLPRYRQSERTLPVSRLSGFFGNGGRGSKGESDRVEQPLSPQTYRFSVGFRF